MKKNLLILILVLFMPMFVHAEVTVTDTQADVIKNQLGYYAYYNGTKEEVKNRMCYEIFDKMTHTFTEAQIGYSQSSPVSEVCARITLSDHQDGTGLTGLDAIGYYNYTYQINSSVSATGKVYTMSDKNKFIVATINNGVVDDYEFVTAEALETYIYSSDSIILFGNGVADISSFNEQESPTVNSALYSNERTRFQDLSLDSSYEIKGTIVNTIKNTTFGVFINRSYSKDTRGWGLSKYPLATLDNTTLASPYKMAIYFGINSIGYDNLQQGENLIYIK